MKKKIAYKTRGHRADIGHIEIFRLLPNNFADHSGHFVFLDYIPPFMQHQKKLNPDAAHPHRGIATLTYGLNGEVDHYDSRGNRSTIHSGGVQWMKAGNGIIHNESIGPDTKAGGKLVHGFQFWVNLPSAKKKEDPEYMALQSEELPLVQLDDNAGTLKVIVGEYGGSASKIPTYAQQYLYHIRLNAGKSFTLPTTEGLDYTVFLPQHEMEINGNLCFAGDLIGFEDKEGNIEFANKLDSEADFIVFGGEKYTEPYAMYGPFVMNSKEEIHQANIDYQNGKYGKMVYG